MDKESAKDRLCRRESLFYPIRICSRLQLSEQGSTLEIRTTGVLDGTVRPHLPCLCVRPGGVGSQIPNRIVRSKTHSGQGAFHGPLRHYIDSSMGAAICSGLERAGLVALGGSIFLHDVSLRSLRSATPSDARRLSRPHVV